MFIFYFISCSFLLVQCSGLAGSHSNSDVALPPWIADNPAFQHPTEVNSITTGNGSIDARGKINLSWLLHLNERTGHGIEVHLTKLSLDPDSGDFLTLTPWPFTSATKQIKLITGTFDKPHKQVRIPNTKSFQVLYCSSKDSSEMAMYYRRYGTALEETPPSTDNPIKKKETIFEVQLKGKAPNEYSDPQLLVRLKEAVREVARRYSRIQKIPFNDSIPTQEMVQVHRVSFCPFEWPDRDICASIEHSVFVSGVRVAGEEFVRDYELSAEHLSRMWSEGKFPELEEMAITVFQLPRTSSTVLYWSLIIGIMAVISLAGSFMFCRNNYVEEVRVSRSFGSEEVKKVKRSKLKLGKQERIPSFMYTEGILGETKEEVPVREKFEDVLKTGECGQLPIKSYFGSILFSNNRAFEEDEDGPAEQPPKSQLK